MTLSLNGSEDGPSVFSDRGQAINFLPRLFDVPQLHGGIFRDRYHGILTQKAKISDPILMFFQVGNFLVFARLGIYRLRWHCRDSRLRALILNFHPLGGWFVFDILGDVVHQAVDTQG